MSWDLLPSAVLAAIGTFGLLATIVRWLARVDALTAATKENTTALRDIKSMLEQHERRIQRLEDRIVPLPTPIHHQFPQEKPS